jgi:3-hydroxy-9,10-secoandrosta-1,3,5(10)-triene-9,17-dione monooxygenase reductase component
MFTTHSASTPQGVAIGRALGRVPSGLFVLSVGRRPTVQATLVSWVQQVGFEPPAVSVALAKGRPMVDNVQRDGVFALSVLGKSQSPLFKRYARAATPGADPFEGIDVRETPGGQLILSEAVGWLECSVLNACDFNGDHILLIAKVIAGEIRNDQPAFVHHRGNGLHY